MPYAFTDSPDFAGRLLGDKSDWRGVSAEVISSADRFIIDVLFGNSALKYSETPANPFGASLFITEKSSQSQYDAIVDLLRNGNKFPDGTACFADHGTRFHGLRERPWRALPGNIHLVVQFAPDRAIAHYGVGFTILAAVSVVQAIDTVTGLNGRARTKWVNDIVVGNAKICGVLTYTQAEGEIVTGAVVGIGLNVETTPEVEPTVFVPEAVSIIELAGENESSSQEAVFAVLLERLKGNYELLLDGGYGDLLDFYRGRSAIPGKMVEIHPDSPYDRSHEIIKGKVIEIGDNLELYLEGRSQPVTKGRLALQS
jgi:biotin-[acetyl-CoA-carboxylase] ligase BirA-like protein